MKTVKKKRVRKPVRKPVRRVRVTTKMRVVVQRGLVMLPQNPMVLRTAQVFDIPYIGGPKDGEWEKLDPNVETQDGYRTIMVPWFDKRYPVKQHFSVPSSDTMRQIIRGYKGVGGRKKSYAAAQIPVGRQIDLES